MVTSMESDKVGGLDKRTVFVRNISFATDQSKLEAVFSTFGPVRQCFIVGDKGAKNHKGFGFVQFSLLEDAERAVTAAGDFLLGGRKLKVEIAKKRAPLDVRRPKGPGPGLESTDVDVHDPGEVNDAADTPASNAKAAHASAPATVADRVTSAPPPKAVFQKRPRVQGQASVTQRSARSIVLATQSGAAIPKTALQVATQVAPLESGPRLLTPDERSKQNLDKDGCPAMAVVLVYSLVRGAMKAVAALHGNSTVEPGVTMWARQLGGQGSKLKKFRLIVRNLAFQVKEAELRKYFETSGFVWELKLPLNSDGKPRGFAFVGYTSKEDAEKAIADLNGIKICGRPIAVDWAISKRDYQAAVTEPAEGDNEKADDPDGDEDEDGDDASTADESEGDEDGHGRHGSLSESEMMHQVMQRVLSSSAEVAPEGGGEEKVNGAAAAEEVRAESPQKQKMAAVEPPPAPAVAENGVISKTLFVRHIPVDAKPEEVRSVFSRFGPLTACRVVLHPVTKRPLGTAFIEYATQEAVQGAIKASQVKSGGGVVVGGARVTASLAVDKGEARRISIDKASKKGNQDNRNLSLAQEGMIPEGSKAYLSMSAADRARRERLHHEKETKLRSPNFAVSRTRLAVHNVPVEWSESEIKEFFIKAVKERATKQNPSITQVKILKDSAKRAADGSAVSRGAAFVEFSEHEHAMVALRALNNHPDAFSKDRRPIVEFAIENRLMARKQLVSRERTEAKRREKRNSGGNKPNNAADAVRSEKVNGRSESNSRKKNGCPVPTKETVSKLEKPAASTPNMGKSGSHGKKPTSAIKLTKKHKGQHIEEKTHLPSKKVAIVSRSDAGRQPLKKQKLATPPILALDISNIGDIKRWFE